MIFWMLLKFAQNTFTLFSWTNFTAGIAVQNQFFSILISLGFCICCYWLVQHPSPGIIPSSYTITCSWVWNSVWLLDKKKTWDWWKKNTLTWVISCPGLGNLWNENSSSISISRFPQVEQPCRYWFGLFIPWPVIIATILHLQCRSMALIESLVQWFCWNFKFVLL